MATAATKLWHRAHGPQQLRRGRSFLSGDCGTVGVHSAGEAAFAGLTL
jgi:hypothetical protein